VKEKNMLDSVKISRRQSEIRETLAELVGKDTPSEDETRQMGDLDGEYRTNETRYRAALVAEDSERRDAKDELESRGGNEWADMLGKFEVRQVALALDEGRDLDGATAEIVTELRANGGYRGIPVPLEALETRVGETIASGTPDPIRTLPIIDRLFAPSAAARMGAQMVQIPQGDVEYPVTTSAVSAGWAATETGNVAGPTVYAVTDRPLQPNNTFGVQMRVTRKALKQSGAALEAAVRRDMSSAILTGVDAAVFTGAGGSGEPRGVISGAAAFGITDTNIGAAPTWAVFRTAIVSFLSAFAAAGPSDAKVMIHPSTWSSMDGNLITSTAVSEYDRMTAQVGAGNVIISTHALADAGSPASISALLTTSAGGVPPIFVGLWGAVDMIRDPFTDAQSGGLRLTGLLTADVTISRTAQLEVLTGIT
jgi:HK97 family phage major capsid protein